MQLSNNSPRRRGPCMQLNNQTPTRHELCMQLNNQTPTRPELCMQLNNQTPTRRKPCMQLSVRMCLLAAVGPLRRGETNNGPSNEALRNETRRRLTTVLRPPSPRLLPPPLTTSDRLLPPLTTSYHLLPATALAKAPSALDAPNASKARLLHWLLCGYCAGYCTATALAIRLK